MRPSTCLLFVIFAFTSCAIAQQPLPAIDRPIELPIEANDNGIIFLKARVDRSRWMSFALDSGASFPIVVDSRRAQEFKLKLGNKQTLASGGGPGKYAVSDVDSIDVDLGDLQLIDQPAKVLALDSLESIAGRHLDGLVGQQLFRQYVVEIDYTNQLVRLHDPRTYAYKGTGDALPLTDNQNYFLVSIKIETPEGKRLDARLVVDTGGGFISFVLNTPFVHKNGLLPEQRTLVDNSLAGLGGPMRLRVGRASSLSLGKFTIFNPVLYLSDDTGGALASSDFDGILGSEILEKFRVIFDVPHRRLIFEPNASFDRPLEYDMSGIRLHAEGADLHRYRICQVLENSPAAKAGLRQGDLLTAIDRKPVSQFPLAKIYEMLKQSGRTLDISFTRKGKTSSTAIKLARLI
jgi:hypothetical protein